MRPSILLSHLKRALIPLALVFAVAGCRTGRDANDAGLAKPGSLSGVTVILDPGHGGADSGAIRAGVREDEINYRMASAIAALLRKRGATVIFTVRSTAIIDDLRENKVEPPLQRPTDACLAVSGKPVRLRRDSSPDDLYDRAAIAQRLWGNLPAGVRESGRGIYFLSLHCDKLSTSRGRGARVYFDKRGKSPSRFAVTLKEKLTTAGLTNSASGMVIPRRYGVLNPTYNPLPESALLEMATLSNPSDRVAVQSAAWRWRLARLVTDAIAASDRPQAQPDLALRQD